MEYSWATGPKELLYHAKSHLEYESSIDDLIAFISVDNAVELTLRTFVSLPPRFHGRQAPSRQEVDRATTFPALLDLTRRVAGAKLDDAPLDDLEYYHRLRNTLYHHPGGISVDPVHLQPYFDLAVQLLEQLLGVKLEPESPILDAFRIDLISSVALEISNEERMKRSSRAVPSIQSAKTRGIQLGRGRKEITTEELELAASLRRKGTGCEKIALEINRGRGVFDIANSSARQKRSVSASTLKRRLQEIGVFSPNEAQTARESTSGG